MGRKRRRTQPGKSGGAARILLALALAFGALLMLDFQMRPVVENMAAYEAKVFSFRIINDAMIQELDDSKISYDDLVSVTQNGNGEIASIQSNMLSINRLKSQINRSVIRELGDRKKQSVVVPLGTLMGNQFTSGRGPQIEMKVLPTGYVQSEIYSQFTSAGINQTLHQILIKTTVQMLVLVPGYSVRTESVSNFCIAETVIVGSIPESFTQIDLDPAPFYSRVESLP